MRLRLVSALLLPLGLAACGGGGPARAPVFSAPQANYPPPGPPGDPWGPYIREASTRFSVPEAWIRAVIRQESGGHAMLNGRPITSAAGAMGLMQLMPATYAQMRDRFGLGSDPYDPHDNIMAGTGYIAALNAKYGAPAFLIAYDWGPRHLDDYLAGRASLPPETVAYLASVGPSVGGGQGAIQVAALRRRRGRCDPDAAYDPSLHCPAHAPAAPVEVAEAGATHVDTVLWAAPSGAAPVAPIAPAPAPQPHHAGFALIPSAYADTVPVTAGNADWGVQVGAFADPDLARRVADQARAIAPDLLSPARSVVGRTQHADGQVFYRARLMGVTHPAANTACTRITAHSLACIVVSPGA